MTEAQAVAGLDRLPWLPDEPSPAVDRRGSLVPWAVGTALVIAAGAWWLGSQAGQEIAPSAPMAEASSDTVPLPQPRPAAPRRSSAQRVEPVEPVVAAPVAIVDKPVARLPDPGASRLPDRSNAQPRSLTSSAPESRPGTQQTPQVWPVRVVQGASGRLIRVGAFSTVHQAKKGWWAIVRTNPAIEHLPALVVPVRSLRNGRTYYRLQMGTTSQAHSAVLCQRMRMISQSCVVIGLNGAQGQVAI